MIIARNFKYKDMTQYMPTCPENYHVQFFWAGTKDNPIVDIKGITIPQGQVITLALSGSIQDIKAIPIIDDINETIMPDQTKIRFYNLDNSTISFDMAMANKSSISRSLSFGERTNYNLISPGEYRFELRSSISNIKPLNINIDLKSGRIYTLYITGSIDPSSSAYSMGNIPQIILSVDGNTLLKKCII